MPRRYHGLSSIMGLKAGASSTFSAGSGSVLLLGAQGCSAWAYSAMSAGSQWGLKNLAASPFRC